MCSGPRDFPATVKKGLRPAKVDENQPELIYAAARSGQIEISNGEAETGQLSDPEHACYANN
jgi:hypothetical protein